MDKDGEVYNRIKELMKKELEVDSSGHDIHHSKRVFNLGMEIAEEEGGDEEVIGAACLTHDMHRTMSKGKKHVDPLESLPRVESILRESGFPEEKIDNVLHCVEVHEEYDFEEESNETESKEARIVQDADNLDAIGAIGIGRAFTFSGAHDRPMWIPGKKREEGYYDKTKLGESTIHHFYDKLFRLKENMNTETGREMAEERHEYMKNFVDRFKKEWKGR